MNTYFNLDEAKDLIRYVIETNRRNQELNIPVRISAELVGDSGVGKTSAVLQVAEELELTPVKLNMSQIEEVGDLCGFPIKKFQIEKDGKKRTVASELLTPFYKQGWMPTSKPPIMSYAIPEWIAGKGPSGILILDDYSRADIRLLQATMELIDRGEYISWKLPTDWHIILTSNPDDGEFIVNTMDKAQKGRYLSATVEYDKHVWARWAESNQVDSRCINFMLMNDEAVRGREVAKGSDARSWTRFFYAIGHLKDFKSKKAKERIEQIGTMAVGADLAATFCVFINEDMDLLPEAEKLLFSKQIKHELALLEPIIRPNGQYRADIGSVIGTRVANFISRCIERGVKRTELFDSNTKHIIISKVLGVDVSFSLAQTLYDRHRQQMAPLFSYEEVRTYLLEG